CRRGKANRTSTGRWHCSGPCTRWTSTPKPVCQDAVSVDGSEPGVDLSNLGVVLLARFEYLDELSDLEAAVDAARRAVDSLPADHPVRPRFLLNPASSLRKRFDQTELAARLLGLGRALHERYDVTEDVTDLDEALQSWERAHTSEAGQAEVRMRAASERGVMLSRTGLWALAADAFASAIALFPLLVWRGIGRSSREARLAGWTG